MNLVIGAAGQTGKLIVTELLRVGKPVRAMVRREEQRAELENLGAEVVLGDLTGGWKHALDGALSVIFAAGAGVSGQFVEIDHLAAVALMGEMAARGPKRLLMITSMGTTYPERLPFIEAVLREKRKAEIVLEASALEWTIVRPGGLVNTPGTGKVQLAQSLQVGGMVPRADVAALCVSVLEDPRSYRKVLEVIAGETALETALEGVLG